MNKSAELDHGWISALDRDRERRYPADRNQNEARDTQVRIRKAKELPRPDAVAGDWVELPGGGWLNTSVDQLEESDDQIALGKVYDWISSLEQLVPKHMKQGRFQVGKFRRSAVGRQLTKFFMQSTSRVGQKNAAVARKNNRVPFELCVYERYNTKKKEHDQKNHGHPKYSYKQFRSDLKAERSKESTAYADLLKPRGRFISGEALRRIVERVASLQISEV